MTDDLQYQLRLPGLYDTATHEQQVEICSLHNKAANRMDSLEDQVDRLVSALQWCSGAGCFQEGGEAREGWLKLCAPLLSEKGT